MFPFYSSNIFLEFCLLLVNHLFMKAMITGIYLKYLRMRILKCFYPLFINLLSLMQ